LTLISVKEETYAALMMLRSEGETVAELIKRLVEYARCYMLIRGGEDSEEKPRAELKRLVRDFVLSRRDDIEKDMENFGALKPVLDYFLAEAEEQ